VRETGQDAQVSAAIEAEAIIAKQDLAILEANQRKADQATVRADEMQSVLFEKRDEQRGYNVKLIGDVAKVAAQYAANAPAASETLVVDQLMDKGVSNADIGKLHRAAKANGFPPGSRAYRNYMMSNYEGATGKAPDEMTASKTPGVAGAPVVPTFAQSVADQLRQSSVPEGATPRPGLTEEQSAEMFKTLGQTPATEPPPIRPAGTIRPPAGAPPAKEIKGIGQGLEDTLAMRRLLKSGTPKLPAAAPQAQTTQPRAEPWTLGGITYRFYPQDRTIRYEDPKSGRTVIINPMDPELQNTKMAAEWKRLMATKPSPWTGGTTPPPE
jgi:hypothetical protein